MKQRIVLINPQIGSAPPFGLLYLSSALENAGCEVEVKELNTYNQPDYHPDGGWIEEIIESRPDYTGIFFTTPYPGTELYEQSRKNKWLDLSEEDISWESDATPKFSRHFNSRELHQIYNSLTKGHYFKIIFGYLKQPVFLFDAIKYFNSRPLEAFRLILLLVLGKRESFINKSRELRITGQID